MKPFNGTGLAVAAGLFVLAAAPAWGQVDTLVDFGATWKYLDDGSNQGTNWRDNAFNDAGWASGPAELGYGDGDEATVVSFGPDANNKYITTYFRHTFNVVNAASYQSLTLDYIFDDGGVVYINGTQVLITANLTPPVSYLTETGSGASGSDGKPAISVPISPAVLQDGSNVIAVEVHQTGPTSSDISMDVRLEASTVAAPITVDRGPYLQVGTPGSIIVRWRTSQATDSRVSFGTSPGSLDTDVDVAGSRTEHEVVLTGLAPARRYYYSIGSTTTVLAGGDANHFFWTNPPAGTSPAFRVWAIGDAGTADADQASVRDAYYALTGAVHTDLWLMLGDNAYNDGTDAQYQGAVFDVYQDLLRKSVLWPTRGNHDRTISGVTPYYDIFTMPTAGEAGGLASGTEAYYSYDFGNAHFICLDSQGSSGSAAMQTWLTNDLNATLKDWIVAYWHHPPYTKGSHDSDSEGTLITMRSTFVPILEAGGVDLVLTGHSHSYERSILLDGQTGPSSDFTANPGLYTVDGGNGQGANAYQKSLGTQGNEGAVYITAGSSGKVTGTLTQHPVMASWLYELGSVVMDFNGNRLDVTFLRENGTTPDFFTIIKSGGVDDSEPDGLLDSWENAEFGNLGQTANGDPDGDGVTNAQEHSAGTDPNDADSDNDGMEDGFELLFGLDPNSGGDAGGDLDGDGFTNLQEAQNVPPTDPTNAASFPGGPPPPAPGGGGGGGSSSCGLTGLEALLLLGLIAAGRSKSPTW